MVWRSVKPTQWFSRRLDDAGDRYLYEFSAYLTGPRKLWQESTRPNALFLSTAAQLNSELLGPVAKWLVQSFVYLPAGAFIDHGFTTSLLESTEGRAAVRDFLATADISIADVSAVSRKGLRSEVMFEHRTERGSAKFELHEESEGTQRLVGMFHDPSLNAHGAQLVFSTPRKHPRPWRHRLPRAVPRSRFERQRWGRTINRSTGKQPESCGQRLWGMRTTKARRSPSRPSRQYPASNCGFFCTSRTCTHPSTGLRLPNACGTSGEYVDRWPHCLPSAPLQLEFGIGPGI